MLVKEEKITRGNATSVKGEILAAVHAGDDALDLSNVTTLDSSAVAIVLAWIRAVQAAGRTPRLSVVPEQMMTLARLYGVRNLITAFVDAPAPKAKAEKS